MFGLVAKCNEFLEKCLDFDNVLGIRKFSICFYSESLKKASDKFLMYVNFFFLLYSILAYTIKKKFL